MVQSLSPQSSFSPQRRRRLVLHNEFTVFAQPCKCFPFAACFEPYSPCCRKSTVAKKLECPAPNCPHHFHVAGDLDQHLKTKHHSQKLVKCSTHSCKVRFATMADQAHHINTEHACRSATPPAQGECFVQGPLFLLIDATSRYPCHCSSRGRRAVRMPCGRLPSSNGQHWRPLDPRLDGTPYRCFGVQAQGCHSGIGPHSAQEEVSYESRPAICTSTPGDRVVCYGRGRTGPDSRRYVSLGFFLFILTVISKGMVCFRLPLLPPTITSCATQISRSWVTLFTPTSCRVLLALWTRRPCR